MIGFFGTVTGMILAFYEMATQQNVTPDVLAGGIYQALLITNFGLIITVIATVFYYIFKVIVKRYSAKIEKAVNDINYYIEGNK